MALLYPCNAKEHLMIMSMAMIIKECYFHSGINENVYPTVKRFDNINQPKILKLLCAFFTSQIS